MYEELFNRFNNITFQQIKSGSLIKDSIDPFSNAYNELLYSLKAYYSSNNPVLPWDFLKYQVISFNGSLNLKRIRKKAIIESFNGSLYEDPEWYSSTPTYLIKEVGDIFNYQYCFPWVAQDDNDYLNSLLPVETDEKILNDFRIKLREILNECREIDTVKDYEVLLNLSGSKALSNGKKNFHYLEKSNHLKFSKIRKEGERVFVTTAPADGRDAIINEIEDLNTIQKIEMQLDILLQSNDYFSHFLVNRNEDVFKEKFKNFFKSNRFFLMRDIKKEGITKPKILLKIMLEELNLRYPLQFREEYINFYSGPWYKGDTGERGHGLGMANNLTTLMQIVVFHLVVQQFINTGSDITIDMICHNDDIVIGIDGNSDDCSNAIDSDIEILEGLGIIVSKDKSFYSDRLAIICERYLDITLEFHPKDSYVKRELNLLQLSCNVTHLKNNLSQFYFKFGKDIDLNQLISKFGYEFHPKEFTLPISLGGWLRDKSYRTSFDIIELEKHYCKRVMKIYLASRLNRTNIGRKKKEKPFIPPFYYLFKKSPDDDVKDSFNWVSDYEIRNQYTRVKFDPDLRQRLWIRLFNKRQKVYNKRCSYIPFKLLAQEIMQDGKNHYPPSFMIDRMVDIEITKGFMKDPYNVPNPISCALKHMKCIKDEDVRSTKWPIKQRTIDDYKKADSRSAIARILNYIPPIFNFYEDEVVLPKEELDFKEFFLSYPAPLLFGKVCQLEGKIPILKSEYFLHEKESVWNRMLTKNEFFLYNSFPFKYVNHFLDLNLDYDYITSFNILSEATEMLKPKNPEPIIDSNESISGSEEEDELIYDVDTMLEQSRELLNELNVNIVIKETRLPDLSDEEILDLIYPDMTLGQITPIKLKTSNPYLIEALGIIFHIIAERFLQQSDIADRDIAILHNYVEELRANYNDVYIRFIEEDIHEDSSESEGQQPFDFDIME